MEEKKAQEEKPMKETEEEAKSQEKPEAGKKKKEEKKGEDSKEGKESKDEPPPSLHEIVLRVYMHCEGCARKVRRCLKGFDGVEDVITDCKTSKVVVKGEKADPLKVVERIQRKSHRQVELISPIPKPLTEKEKEEATEDKEKPKPEEKKVVPQDVAVVLKIYMHCEACAMEIKKRIQKMEGVESAEPDIKSSEVTVKGAFDPPKLVDYVYKRTGKQTVIVKQEPEKKEEEKCKDPKEEKEGVNEVEKEKKNGGDQAENKENKEGEEGNPGEVTTEETTVVELKRNGYYCHPQSYPLEMVNYAYTPQIFSDENPNACTVM